MAALQFLLMKSNAALVARFLVPIIAFASLARAADTAGTSPDMKRARQAAVFTAYFENDILGNTDQHYTAGTKLSWLSSDYSQWRQHEGVASQVGDRLPLVNEPGTQKNLGFAIGQNIYTPQRKDLVVPDPADRPYAGWSYLEFSFLSKSDSRLDTLSFQLGIIGPHSYAKQIQREVHRIIDSEQALGWDHQLKDEFGMNVVFERKWRLYAWPVADVLGVDFVPHVGVSLGNVQTYANTGGTARLGFNLPSDFGVQLIRPGGAGSTPSNDQDPRVSLQKNFSVFIFGAADGRAVARDIFLDGNTFRDSPSVDKEALVADLSYGVGVIAGRWQLTFTQVTRTREFTRQVERFNRFGSATLSMAF
jgi:lipid A 3-O-deacylase